MTVLAVLFWLCLFGVVWTYAGYPITLMMLSPLFRKRVLRNDKPMPVSMVVTAYNEEKRIAEKIENSLSLDFPRDKLEIIVVSDASTDRTNEIVQSYEGRGVKLLVIPERHGKHYGQGRWVQAAANEIVVMSDATTFLEPRALTRIVGNFADPTIGCVSGYDTVDYGTDKVQGEGIYVKYEMALRELESEIGSILGVSGCFSAARKAVCDQWIDDMSSDFYLPIIARQKGYRAVLDNEARARYRVIRSQHKEFDRKVRTVLHGLEVLFHFKSVLNPFHYGTFALQMVSHKLLRWMVPFFLVAVFGLNAMVLDLGLVYRLTFAVQVLFYAAASAALVFEKLQDLMLFRFVSFFVMVNMSILAAWYKFWTNQKLLVWEATKR